MHCNSALNTITWANDDCTADCKVISKHSSLSVASTAVASCSHSSFLISLSMVKLGGYTMISIVCSDQAASG